MNKNIELPEDWEVKCLDSISTEIGDGIHTTPKYVKSSDYFFINGNNLFNGEILITEDTKCVCEQEYNLLKKNLNSSTILISINGTIGNLAYYKNEKVVLGKSVAYVNIKKDFEKRLIFYLFQHSYIKDYFKYELTGTTINNLSLKSLRKTPIPIPPTIREQNKIASILSTVDDLIENTGHFINSYTLLKKSLMQILLTKGIGHTEFRKTILGEIPLEWEVKRLNELGNLKGGSGFKIKYQGNKDCSIPFYKVSDMNIPANNIFMKDCNNTIDEQIRKKLGAYLFNENIIIFAKVGAALLLNRRRILTKPSCIDNNMMGFEVINDFYKYFYYYLQLIDFGKFVNEGAVPSVNQSQVGEIEVAVPPIPEQEKISNILTNIDNLIENKTYLLDSYNFLKKGLIQQLLTGKIRVKV